jgi:hypothetical protein
MPRSYSWSDYQSYSSACSREASGDFSCQRLTGLGQPKIPIRNTKPNQYFFCRGSAVVIID